MDRSTSLPTDRSEAQAEQLERWLREARNGSPSALGRALEASRNYLLVVAHRQLGGRLKPKVGASDLVQDTFLAAQQGFGAFRGATEHEFFAWLLGIMAHRVANNVRHYARTQRRNVAFERPLATLEGGSGRIRDPGLTPGTSFLALDEQRRVREAIERLNEPMKSILLERSFQGVSFAEIGARYDCSADAARKTWLRAVRKLQLLLTQIE